MKKSHYQVGRAGVALEKIVSIESCGLSRDPRPQSRPSLFSARSIAFMVFLPVYAATSQMFGPVDAIRTVLNHIILWLALIAGALSSWRDWRVRRAGLGGILLHFPRHRMEIEGRTVDTQHTGPQ